MSLSKLIIGCGYLGRRVAQRWIAQGDDVFALTRSPDRARVFRDSGIEPIVGDVTDAATLAGLPEVDTLLWAVGLDRAAGRSQREVYVGGLENMLPRIVGRVRRWIYISSTSVYGQTEGEWVDESSECRPELENGKVCLEAETRLRAAEPEANILRLAGIYGPGRLVARLAALRAGLVLDGSPEAWLNLIHVDDAVASVIACERRGTPGTTYLVCDNQPCRRSEYYSLLANLIGAPAPRTSEIDLSANASVSLNKRCSNRRLRDELQVAFRYPTIHTGLPHATTTTLREMWKRLHSRSGERGGGHRFEEKLVPPIASASGNSWPRPPHPRPLSRERGARGERAVVIRPKKAPASVIVPSRHFATIPAFPQFTLPPPRSIIYPLFSIRNMFPLASETP